MPKQLIISKPRDERVSLATRMMTISEKEALISTLDSRWNERKSFMDKTVEEQGTYKHVFYEEEDMIQKPIEYFFALETSLESYNEEDNFMLFVTSKIGNYKMMFTSKSKVLEFITNSHKLHLENIKPKKCGSCQVQQFNNGSRYCHSCFVDPWLQSEEIKPTLN